MAEAKKLCALFYILNHMDKLLHLTLSNFQSDKLKSLLPTTKWNLLDNDEIKL